MLEAHHGPAIGLGDELDELVVRALLVPLDGCKFATSIVNFVILTRAYNENALDLPSPPSAAVPPAMLRSLPECLKRMTPNCTWRTEDVARVRKARDACHGSLKHESLAQKATQPTSAMVRRMKRMKSDYERSGHEFMSALQQVPRVDKTEKFFH